MNKTNKPWDEGEPNNHGGEENCVALDTRCHGKYNDVWCHGKMPYVCESSRRPRTIRDTSSLPNMAAKTGFLVKANEMLSTFLIFIYLLRLMRWIELLSLATCPNIGSLKVYFTNNNIRSLRVLILKFQSQPIVCTLFFWIPINF